MSAAAVPACNLRRPIFSSSAATLSLRLPNVTPPLRRPIFSPSGSRQLLLSQPCRRILPKVQAKKETFSSFDDLLQNSDKPVLVDFYATWCGPCQFMVPVLESVSSQLKDRVQVVKIDTEKYASIANRFKIEGLPTFIIFRDGEPLDRVEGALPADQLIQWIDKALYAEK